MSQTPASPLDVTAQRALLTRAIRWIEVIKEKDAVIGDFASEPWNEGTWIDVHVLALALKHLDVTMRILGELAVQMGFANESNTYRTAWAGISSLRDALEHEDEYVAGRGKYSDTPAAWWDEAREQGHDFGPTFGWSRERGLDVLVLGRHHYVSDAVLCARALLAPLSTALAQLKE